MFDTDLIILRYLNNMIEEDGLGLKFLWRWVEDTISSLFSYLPFNYCIRLATVVLHKAILPLSSDDHRLLLMCILIQNDIYNSFLSSDNIFKRGGHGIMIDLLVSFNLVVIFCHFFAKCLE